MTTIKRISNVPNILGPCLSATYRATCPDSKPYDGCVTILFAGRPMLVWHGTLTPIDEPWRFGAYGTPKERRQYVRRFLTD